MDSQVERTHNYPLIACPHCGREVPSNASDMHMSVCAHRPEMRARILAALTTDVPGVGARLKDYDRARIAHGAAHATTPIRAYGGTWTAVLEAFGLVPWESPNKRTPRTPQQARMTARQREQAAIEDVAQMEADARRVLAAEYDAAHTLKAYRVEPEPGLRVNGNECVRLMLR